MAKCVICKTETDYTVKATKIHVCPMCGLYEGRELVEGYAHYLESEPDKPQTFRVFKKVTTEKKNRAKDYSR